MSVNDFIQSPYSLIVTMAFELQYAAKKSGKGNDLRSAMDLGQHWERRNHSTLTTGHYIVRKCHVCVWVHVSLCMCSVCLYVCMNVVSLHLFVPFLAAQECKIMHAQCN